MDGISPYILDNKGFPEEFNKDLGPYLSSMMGAKQLILMDDTIMVDQNASFQNLTGLEDSGFETPKDHVDIDNSLRLDMSTMWMEKNRVKTQDQIVYKIPCMYIGYGSQPLSKVLLYFHSNAEDIYLSRPWCEQLAEGLGISVIAVEYPGYGYYVGYEPSEEQICSDSLYVYDFLVSELGVSSGNFTLTQDNIWILSRSIGCVPAVHLASRRKISMLVMVSPFMSLKVQ